MENIPIFPAHAACELVIGHLVSLAQLFLESVVYRMTKFGV